MAELIRDGEVQVVPDVLVDQRLADGWTHVVELEGADLNAALKAADLPATGKTVEKQQRLVEHHRDVAREHEIAELSTANLNAALKAADLPATGKAPEKRQRLLEYRRATS